MCLLLNGVCCVCLLFVGGCIRLVVAGCVLRVACLWCAVLCVMFAPCRPLLCLCVTCYLFVCGVLFDLCCLLVGFFVSCFVG